MRVIHRHCRMRKAKHQKLSPHFKGSKRSFILESTNSSQGPGAWFPQSHASVWPRFRGSCIVIEPRKLKNQHFPNVLVETSVSYCKVGHLCSRSWMLSVDILVSWADVIQSPLKLMYPKRFHTIIARTLSERQKWARNSY